MKTKKILITGANSYIGSSFERWLASWPNRYQVDTVPTTGGEWREYNFGAYDALLHVAAIVHAKEKKDMANLYQSVNRDLTIALAQKAKREGVSQFVFLSTMAVYGMTCGIITQNTHPAPKTMYAWSKWEAEQELNKLHQERVFATAILRPPMVYGPNCPGNYACLEQLARITPIFPDIDNQRSMIHIDNLCRFLKTIIDNQAAGLFFPQDSRYKSTTEIVRELATRHGKNIRTTRVFNPLIDILSKRSELVGKVFGSLIYDLE